tara:strand:- start:1978 stop:2769 length:792 start_codon:yes stop_codon:yes gene_type:complete
MIKILTGYSDKGGSTVALSNLTNSLNDAGYETIMYGPHDYHLGLCKSDKLTQEVINNLTDKDRVITHFLQLPTRPKGKVVVLSCHEKWWFDVGGIKQHWDEVIFLHQAHKDYHNKYKGDYSIIPNIKEPFIKKDKEEIDKVAGIIGAIEDRKQTHISIQRALKDRCKKIYLFGKVNDNNYYNSFVKPLLNSIIIEYGYTDSKQEMYDMIGRVYHSSKGEVACLVKDECWSTGTKFFGGVETENDVFDGTNEEIIEKWKKVLKI